MRTVRRQAVKGDALQQPVALCDSNEAAEFAQIIEPAVVELTRESRNTAKPCHTSCPHSASASKQI